MHEQHNKILDVEFYCNTTDSAADHCAIVQFIVGRLYSSVLLFYYSQYTFRWRVKNFFLVVLINDAFLPSHLQEIFYFFFCLWNPQIQFQFWCRLPLTLPIFENWICGLHKHGRVK